MLRSPPKTDLPGVGILTLSPAELCVLRAHWTKTAQGEKQPQIPPPPKNKKKLAGGEGRVGFCLSMARDMHTKPDAIPELGLSKEPATPMKEPTTPGVTFIPAIHVGRHSTRTDLLRVSFAIAMLPPSAVTLLSPADVLPALPKGTVVHTVDAIGNAQVGGTWPGFYSSWRDHSLVCAWVLCGGGMFIGILLLVDLACVAGILLDSNRNSLSIRLQYLSLYAPSIPSRHAMPPLQCT